METREINKKIEEFLNTLNDLKSKLLIDEKNSRIEELNKLVNDMDFWSRSDTKEVLEEQKNINNILNKYNKLNDNICTLKELIDIASEEELEEIYNELLAYEKEIDELKLSTFLSGEYDSSPAYLQMLLTYSICFEIHGSSPPTETTSLRSSTVLIVFLHTEG